jgi:hypothetical protein
MLTHWPQTTAAPALHLVPQPTRAFTLPPLLDLLPQSKFKFRSGFRVHLTRS